jgi:hypothetical protein
VEGGSEVKWELEWAVEWRVELKLAMEWMELLELVLLLE